MTLTQITEKGIKDGEIVNADINASAAIAKSKLASLDIVNGDINSSAAIAGSKINPSFTSNITITNTHPKIFLTDSNNTSDFSIQNENGNLNFYDETNTASRIRIISTGLMGVGTTSPGFKLDVAHNTTDTFRINNTNETGHGSHDAKIVAGGSYYQNPTIVGREIKFRTFNTSATEGERIRIDKDGKLGINVTAPSELLTVGDGDLKFFHSNAANAHRTTFIEFGNSSNRITSEMNYGSDSSSNYTAGLKFTTKNFNGSSFQTVDALNIQANGRVGIGTTSPSQKLTVAYSNGSPWSTSSLGVGMKVENTNAVNGVAAGIELRSFQDNGGASIQYIHAVNDGTSSYGSDLVFSTRVAYTGAYRESCRITNAGNLKMPSGHGIDFSAAPNSGGMNSELLDRYEEGTWTPAWVGSSGTGTFGYSHQVGKYTRIGRHVFYTWLIVATSHSGTTGGAIRVGGLPFAVDASESPSGGTVFFIIGFNDSFDNSVVTQLNSSEEIEFYKQVQSSGANYNSVSASSMNLGGLYAKGAGHYIS